MNAIVTLLSSEQNLVIEDIWATLHANCDLNGIAATPVPHFSWHAATGYDLSAVDRILSRTAAEMAPFQADAGGLGLFMNPEPVLYLPVVKNRYLLEAHERLWPTLNSFGDEINSYYAPQIWMPHITLAQWDLSTERIECAIGVLKDRALAMSINVNNLAIIYQTNREVGAIWKKYPFKLASGT